MVGVRVSLVLGHTSEVIQSTLDLFKNQLKDDVVWETAPESGASEMWEPPAAQGVRMRA